MATVLNRFQLMMLICQTIGITNINSVPAIALSHGATGCVLIFFATYILLGIPLMYMELIIGQFTGRDCVDVWKIRPCLSYTGYVLILWQVLILVYNHVFLSFTAHYFLISFENPIPYYKCGPWSKKNCDILIYNYTVNENCMKIQHTAKYCNRLHSTFPEFQYWRYNILGLNTKCSLHVAWRVCLASGLISIFLYLSCFKRKQSIKWVVSCLPIYPILGFIPIMMGSMLQKGLVSRFEDALDLDFSQFTKKFRMSSIIQQVVYNLGIGSGVSLNFGSTSSFRYNCFSNSVLAVVLSAVFSILVISTNIMMAFPYAYQYGITSDMFLKLKISLIFEKVPRLLHQYDHKLFWLFLVYSCYVSLGLCTHVLVLYNLIETVAMKSEKVSGYPGLTCLVAVIILFLITIPLLSNAGVMFALAFRRYVTLVSTFIVMIECIVFVMCYGTHRFSEDVHFMLGIQPSFYMKTAWILAVAVLGYAFFSEIIYSNKIFLTTSSNANAIGGCLIMSICGIIVICCVGKLLVAAFRKKILKVIALNPNWGPKCEILRRSRGMFSAQAMTKEYMYRQYHLQAGILARQRNSNKRNLSQFEEQRCSL